MKAIPILILALFAATSYAQPAPPKDGDQVAQNLFPPELVIRYQREIALDDAQTKALKDLVQKATSRFVDLQWDMQAETGKLAQLMSAHRIDETAALTQLDRVLNTERDVKKAQITLLLRIKNLLTDAQQEKLMSLRSKGL